MENYGNGNGFNRGNGCSNNYLSDIKDFRKFAKNNSGFEVVTARGIDKDGNWIAPNFSKDGRYGNWICNGNQIVAAKDKVEAVSAPHHKLSKRGVYYNVWIVLKKI